MTSRAPRRDTRACCAARSIGSPVRHGPCKSTHRRRVIAPDRGAMATTEVRTTAPGMCSRRRLGWLTMVSKGDAMRGALSPATRPVPEPGRRGERSTPIPQEGLYMQQLISALRSIRRAPERAFLLAALLRGAGRPIARPRQRRRSPAEPVGTSVEALTTCSGAVDSVRSLVPAPPLSWESWDLSHHGLAQRPVGVPGGKVTYDYRRCASDGSANTDGTRQHPGVPRLHGWKQPRTTRMGPMDTTTPSGPGRLV